MRGFMGGIMLIVKVQGPRTIRTTNDYNNYICIHTSQWFIQSLHNVVSKWWKGGGSICHVAWIFTFWGLTSFMLLYKSYHFQFLLFLPVQNHDRWAKTLDADSVPDLTACVNAPNTSFHWTECMFLSWTILNTGPISLNISVWLQRQLPVNANIILKKHNSLPDYSSINSFLLGKFEMSV